jgi:6-phosphogluconolactonase (cycloisomerase 2 family)
MRFTKFGKAFLMSVLSAGVILGIASCVQSYSVGYLYVVGTHTAASGDNGIVSGFKIDHNKGKLTPINGIPIASGGSNPVRAVLLSGGRFLYVLNAGKSASGGPCTTNDPCSGGNITQFSIGGNGVLATQGQASFSQGFNPMRMFTDTTGTYLYVLDHDAPDNYATSYDPATNACTLALGSGVKTCGDISAFKIDSNTGRLTKVLNSQVTAASGSPLTYFPVPANPIDFVLSSSYVLTMSGTPDTGDAVFPYTYNAANGQLTINQNSSQPLNIAGATAIVSAGGFVYVLDNETLTLTPTGSTSTTASSWVFPYTVGTGGSLQAALNGAVPDSASLSNPNYLIVESKGKWAYMSNYGNNDTTSGSQGSGITGYVLDPQAHTLTEIPGSPFGSGSGPSCLLEDPSNQFIYTANFNDSTVTGSSVDQNSGVLRPLPGSANKAYPLDGPATWCVATGRTS